ncbi:endonuclease/exonuclease/phosphatase family protein [Aquimarina agarivorans]|uniref:endonuclease/exonuclease/phosphatase family protein n=1 Tax=Aquimarina agarivorans TaxID=980584 RepID=UPI000248F869|nr:endonuclease/exonuclease/phosphatase family protein [Aquimarina agarivorans]
MKRIPFLLNSIVVVLSLGVLLISYIPPTKLHFVNYCSLLMPALLVVNFGFVLYWLLQLNKKVLLSALFLVVSAKSVQRLYGFNFGASRSNQEKGEDTIKLMTYNSRHFSSADEHFVFIDEFMEVYKDSFPDILIVQETYTSKIRELKKVYPYTTKKIKKSNVLSNYILSKYPITNQGLIQWKDTQMGRDAAFADIKIKNDTIRFYSIHLSSYKFSKKAEELQKRGGKSILKRFSQVFKYQEKQVEIIKTHIAESPFPVVIGGDFNNNAFSYVYKRLFNSSNFQDTFVAAGSGFGATYDFSYFPTRIDFIFVPESAVVHAHKIVKRKGWSDHFPVISEISF